MGRSRNTALVLVSQNAGDLLNEQVTNCLSSVFAFRSTERWKWTTSCRCSGSRPRRSTKRCCARSETANAYSVIWMAGPVASE